MKVFSIWLPIIFCALAFGLHSCTASREYEGEYPELFSQACYTLTYAEGKLLVHYAPALERDKAARRETRSFLNKVYRGSVGLMVSAMADEKALSRAEIEELYDILRKAEEGMK